MHTLQVVTGGLVLLGVFILLGRLRGAAARGARLFIPVWFVLAAVNLLVGVFHAGYSFAAELPIFLAVFAVPAVIAYFSAGRLA